MTFTTTQLLFILLGYQALSSAANAMSSTDRTLYGFLRRFLLLLTNSAAKDMEQYHINVPTQAVTAEVTAETTVTSTK